MERPLNQEILASVLMWLQPRSPEAYGVVTAHRSRPGRVVRLLIGPVQVDMLQISMNESLSEARGVVGFGRNAACSIWFRDNRISSQHCHIDINPSSGQLILRHTGRPGMTWLDNEPVDEPPQRALVPGHARYLRVGLYEFQIHWPDIDDAFRSAYQESKKRIAARIREAQGLNLAQLDVALNIDAPTRFTTKPPSSCGTPGRLPPSEGPGPLETNIKLGAGSFGTAMLAVNRVTGDWLVVKKIMKPDRTEMEKRLRPNQIAKAEMDVYREIDILCQLRHVS